MINKPSFDYLKSRLFVDTELGKVTWRDATKHHRHLNGTEAGSPRGCAKRRKTYWHVKIDGVALKRAHIVFLFSTGRWPSLQIDHINGNSLDDRIANLREATVTENAWNHKGRRKSTNLPMGVRRLPSGKFEARIACNKVKFQIGSFVTLLEAQSAYQQKRKELFGEFA